MDIFEYGSKSQTRQNSLSPPAFPPKRECDGSGEGIARRNHGDTSSSDLLTGVRASYSTQTH